MWTNYGNEKSTVNFSTPIIIYVSVVDNGVPVTDAKVKVDAAIVTNTEEVVSISSIELSTWHIYKKDEIPDLY